MQVQNIYSLCDEESNIIISNWGHPQFVLQIFKDAV